MDHSQSFIESQLERILMRVQKPGRYVGGELNQVHKPWDSVSTRVALLFPDVYDIGLPNLGLAILYDAINRRPDALADRVYSPWTDMEAELRATGVPLFAVESKQSLLSFDVLAVTLPYETLYTNVLNAFDLAGIPLRGADRDASHPLIIAGGHGAFNPEPMAAFIDAFVIGEGEEAIHDVIDAVQAWKSTGQPRAALLEALAQIPGMYVPSLYEATYDAAGGFAGVKPISPKAPATVYKRVLGQLPPPVTRFLVPSIDVVHNRVAIEIMRGCTRGCRFCSAGMITRPVRERSAQEVIEAIEAAIDATGYEEVALLSLSSSDYRPIVELVDSISTHFAGRQLNISLPSLRIESFSVELMEKLKELRPGGGFTLAPEAATERMRQIINKPVSTEQLLDTAREIYSRGWTTIKLYFMIGHPSETLEDVQAIADVCKQVLAIGRKQVGFRAKVHAGVSTFIPKPHTPFQWEPCDTVENITAKQNLLKRELKAGNNLKLTWVAPKDTLLEAWLSRGDRRTGDVIERAWQLGVRFDAWQDFFHFPLWEQAFAECGIDPLTYSHRARSTDEVLPWGHISTAVRPSYLKQEYEWSQQGKLREDCRDHCYACGILPQFNDLRVQLPDDAWFCPPVPARGN